MLKLKRDNISANSFASFFFICYINFFLVFGMKYWTLSLKLEALMQREEQISNSNRTIIKVLYLVLELVTLCGAILILVYPYRFWNAGVSIKTLLWIGFSMLMFTSFASFFFVCDGFRRVNKLLDHNNLGISRKQILLHIGSFIIATIVLGFCFYLISTGSLSDVLLLDLSGLNRFLNFRIYTAASCIVLIALAMGPIIYIVNSLLDQSIYNQRQQ